MVTIGRSLGNKAFNLIAKIKLILDFIVLFFGGSSRGSNGEVINLPSSTYKFTYV